MAEHGITLPVTVIGGITAADVPALKANGAYCYAVSGAISNAADPEEVTRQFLSEMECLNLDSWDLPD